MKNSLSCIIWHHPNLKISKSQLRKLFSFATSQTHFLFDGQYYDQIDGLSMGSPLGPTTMANVFMGYHEQDWLAKFPGPPVLFYKRYIDDVICVFQNEENALKFLTYLNSKHPNIKFTIEKENEGVLSFFGCTCSKRHMRFIYNHNLPQTHLYWIAH